MVVISARSFVILPILDGLNTSFFQLVGKLLQFRDCRPALRALRKCTCPCKNGCNGVRGGLLPFQMLIVMALYGSVRRLVLVVSVR